MHLNSLSISLGSKIEYPLLKGNLYASSSPTHEDGLNKCLPWYIFEGTVSITDAWKYFCSHNTKYAPWLKVDMEHQYEVTKVITLHSHFFLLP